MKLQKRDTRRTVYLTPAQVSMLNELADAYDLPASRVLSSALQSEYVEYKKQINEGQRIEKVVRT